MEDIATRLNNILKTKRNGIIIVGQDEDPLLDFASSAARTLSSSPKWLECRFLYDARGSELFDQICKLPEYYLTRTESSLLGKHVSDISKLTGPVTLVEFGSGNSVKTQNIFSAYLGRYGLTRYVPVDVSRVALQQASDDIEERHPSVCVAGINGTYDCAFPFLKELSPVMVIFLGSTLGNFYEEQEAAFWKTMSRCLAPKDFILLGADLVKDVKTLEAAYNDADGVTASFTLNLFERMNRELGSGIDLSQVEHVARFSAKRNRVEIFARFNTDQQIRISPLNKSYSVLAGECIHVEISRKFRLETLVARLASFGFETVKVFTDERKWFSLLLLQKAPHNG
jgi:L-histidine N-alpha-methyltransferase